MFKEGLYVKPSSGTGAGTQIITSAGVLQNVTANANIITSGTFATARIPTGISITGNAATSTKWATARTITLGGDLTGSVSLDGSANVTLSAQVSNDSHTHDGRYFTESESDGRYTRLDHIRSLGTQAFTGGSNPNITTAQLISEMEGDGAFDSYSSVFKTSWSYAGNYNL